jgi:hypothetical protein
MLEKVRALALPLVQASAACAARPSGAVRTNGTMMTARAVDQATVCAQNRSIGYVARMNENEFELTSHHNQSIRQFILVDSTRRKVLSQNVGTQLNSVDETISWTSCFYRCN